MFQLKKKSIPGQCEAKNCKRPPTEEIQEILLCSEHAAAARELIGEEPAAPVELAVAGPALEQEAQQEAIEAEAILSDIRTLPVETTEEQAFAAEMLAEVKGAWKKLESRKKEITRPMEAALKSVRELFKPVQELYVTCEVVIKEKLAAAREASLAAQQEALEAASEMEDPSEALALSEELAPDRLDGIQFREAWDYRLTDKSLVPLEYLAVDGINVRKAITAGVREIPGLEIYSKTQVASRSSS